MNPLHDIRILVIPSWYPPNGGYFFKEHAMTLAQLGIEVDVLAGVHRSLRSLSISQIHAAFSTKSASSGTFREFRRDCWIVPFSEKANFAVWLHMMGQFFEWYVRTHGTPHIIIAHSAIWAGVLASKIKKTHGIPYIIVEHRSRFVFNTPESRAMFKPWYDPFLKRAFETASHIVTVSSCMQDYIRKCGGEIKEKISSIPNMVDTDFFHPAPAPLPLEPFTFFSLGSLENVKGMDVLLKAFAILHRLFPGQYRLIIGGSGGEQKKLESFVAENNLNTFIRFEGQMERETVKQRMQESQAFVLASRFEAFGVVFIEAMACGIPVIGTYSGGPPDFVENQHGILVEADNPSELAEAMQEMKNRYQSFNRENIRADAVSKFSREAVALQYYELIKNLLKPDAKEIGS